MVIIRVLVLFILFAATNSLIAIELRPGNKSIFEPPQEEAKYRQYFLSGELPGTSVGHISLGANEYFSLDNLGNLSHVEAKPKTLNSYYHHIAKFNEWKLELNHDLLEYDLVNRLIDSGNEGSFLGESKFGCLNNPPLNAYDLDEDGVDEIIAFSLEDIFIFSQKYQKVIFNTKLFFEDSLGDVGSTSYLKDAGEQAQLPQYASAIAASDIQPYIEPALTGFAKIFVGDFDQSGKFQIIVWRKLYISKLRGDDSLGFRILTNTYQYFIEEKSAERISAFRLQDTEEDFIINLLDSSSLSWQQGFPTNSRCHDVTNTHIPQSHSILLNDEDVLR